VAVTQIYPVNRFILHIHTSIIEYTLPFDIVASELAQKFGILSRNLLFHRLLLHEWHRLYLE